tara:strand:+ start:801 stop:1058 length:258 start_codon:yes stop_codon:yes gene_type:complete
MEYKIVEVYWIDAETTGDGSWMDLTEAIESAILPPPIMRTVGFLLADEDDHISLTDSLGTEECGNINKIPRKMIRQLNEIRHMGE